MDERSYYLGFSAFSGIGPIKFAKLLRRFKTAKTAWESSALDLKEDLGEVLTAKFDAFRKEFYIQDYTERLQQKDVLFLTLADEKYPQLLKETPKPPIVLYIKGSTEVLRSAQDDIPKLISVVGTRRTTQYGREVTRLLTQDLVSAGFTIVSGLAIGVDTISHQVTLEQKGKTIAVLGCGVDCCNPHTNIKIYNNIIQNSGAVISEIPLGEPPTPGLFPARNRIIAGLSVGTVVTEGAEDSGSLITADYAFKFNRKVFAVPGPITSSLSQGPYSLIQKGAKLVTKAEDIIQELGIMNHESGSKDKEMRGETEEERMIIDLLQNEALTFDELVKRSKLSSSEVGSLLSMMEIKGYIKGSPAGSFSITS